LLVQLQIEQFFLHNLKKWHFPIRTQKRFQRLPLFENKRFQRLPLFENKRFQRLPIRVMIKERQAKIRRKKPSAKLARAD
jgi:hypothetical protein